MSNDESKKKNQSRQSKKKDTLKKNTWVKSG